MYFEQIDDERTRRELHRLPGGKISFSQFGEDILISAILASRKILNDGFFVDIGAHHPFKFSNTALLSRFRNWRGINIDASQTAIDEFNLHRERDINICAAISDISEVLEYAEFNKSGINTLDPDMRQRQEKAKHGAFRLERVTFMKTIRLDEVLNEYLPANTKIDFLNVDVEGLDLKVLKSNDWNLFQPTVIAIETHGMKLWEPETNEICKYLTNQRYKIVSHCFVTSIFVRQQKPP
jgi:FkbM family methyltransferase